MGAQTGCKSTWASRLDFSRQDRSPQLGWRASGSDRKASEMVAHRPFAGGFTASMQKELRGWGIDPKLAAPAA